MLCPLPWRFLLTSWFSICSDRGRSLVVANLDEMLVRVEDIHGFTSALLARTLHVADRVERVSIRNARRPDAAEHNLELFRLHSEREMNPALGPPRREQ